MTLNKVNQILTEKISLLKIDRDTFFLGDVSSLTLHESFLTIRHPRTVSRVSIGDKNIPYKNITAVQIKKSEEVSLFGRTSYTSGFIQFTILGGREKQGGIFNALNDENSVTFLGEEKNIELKGLKGLLKREFSVLMIQLNCHEIIAR